MSGKAALILVMGFSFIYLVIARFWNQVTSRAVDNQVEYYSGTVAHNIALSGINMELSKVYMDSWEVRTLTRPFQGGTMSITDAQTDAVTRLITSVGSFMGVSRTAKVKLMRSSYAKYAWFTGSVSGSRKFITGDKIWGGMHSNPAINIEGDPIFYGKVTSSKGINPGPSQMEMWGYHPQFLGGFRTGVEVDFVNNYQFTAEKTAAASGGKYLMNKDLWLTFKSNGSLVYMIGNGNNPSVNYSAPQEVSITSFAPNGVICVEKGDVYVSGKLKGKVTIVANQSSGSGGGNVYFVNDMTYSKDPMVLNSDGQYVPDNTCTDLLEVMASNYAVISTSDASGGKTNNVSDKEVNIHAAIFCAKGGLKVEDLNSFTTGTTGIITLQGSMVSGVEEEAAKLDVNHNLEMGYNRHVIFDERFLQNPPPHIPLSNEYNIVSWLE